MRVLLHSGPGIIGSLIRWQTRSEFSHASLLFSDDTVIESREFRGVRKLHVNEVYRAMHEEPKLRISVYEFFRPISKEQEAGARRFAEEQIGLGYDYMDVVSFLTRRRRTEDDAWFCSELVSAVCRRAGRPLFHDTADWEVAPGLIPRSLALTYAGELR